jgi:hypothetical protein
MVDYNLKDPRILTALSSFGALDVKTTIECGFEQGTHDDVLIKGTSEKRRLLLTKDKETIDEIEFPPCTHGGIIIIKDKRPMPENVIAWMKAFIQSGKRELAKHHVTHLWPDRAVIHTHRGTEEVRL